MHRATGRRVIFTALLGVTFLVFKGYEYYTDYRDYLIPGWRFEDREWLAANYRPPGEPAPEDQKAELDKRVKDLEKVGIDAEEALKKLDEKLKQADPETFKQQWLKDEAYPVERGTVTGRVKPVPVWTPPWVLGGAAASSVCRSFGRITHVTVRSAIAMRTARSTTWRACAGTTIVWQ